MISVKATDGVEFAREDLLGRTIAPAALAPSYVGDIGSATSKTTGTTLIITTTAAVAAGDDIIVAFATYGDPNYTISVTDSAGNTYEEAAQAVCYTHGRTYIFAAYDVNALPSGGTITITHTSVGVRAAVASVFSGLAEISPLDQSLGNPAPGAEEQASGTTPTVGPTGTTAQADELLIGAIGTEGPVGDAAGTWDYSFTAGPRAGTTGDADTSNWTISMGYRIVSATGEYTAQKSGITSRYWAAAIATFKTENTLSADSYSILLGRPTDDSVTLNAIFDQAGQVYFEYGTSTGSYTSGSTSTLPVTAGTPVEVVISGLDANTQYFYRAQFQPTGLSTWLPSDEYSFHTWREVNETFTFTITSDSHLGQTFSGNTPERYEQTTLNVAADQPDFHLDLGDAFIMSETTDQDDANDIYLAQRPYFGNFSHSSPLFLAIGNHENEEGWNFDDTPFSQALGSLIARKQYFLNPAPDGFYSGNEDLLPAIGGDQLREDYYAWEWGDALFVVLDPFQYTMTKPYGPITGSGEADDEDVDEDQWHWTLGAAQFDWFKQTLEDSNARFKFVFSHHVVGGQLNVSGAAGTPGYVRGGALAAPYFEWGGKNTDDTWGFDTERSGWGVDPIHQLMIDNGVSAFFHGHDHQFVHEEIDGIVYQLVPSASMTGYGFDLYDDSTYVVEGGNLPNSGHLRVTVSPGENQATVDYVRSDPTDPINGQVSHSYTIAAAPAPTCYALTLSHSGQGSDPVADPTRSSGCPSGEYVAEAIINLSGAVPDSGWGISGWTGTDDDSSTESSNTVTMPASPHSASVIYTETTPTCYALTLSHSGQGTNPQASPANSPGCDPGEYVSEASINLSGAVPASGWEISSWTGTNNDTSTANTNTVTMPASAHTASVNYTQITYDLTMAVEPIGAGTTDPAVGVHSFAVGTVVTVTATPEAGYTFDYWSGACTGSGACQVTMDADKTVTAHFSGTAYDLTILVDPVGGGTTVPAAGVHSYADGFVVDITATAAAGYVFDHWSGACTGDDACQVTMDADKSVTAHFEEITLTCYALTLSHSGQGSDPVASPASSSGCPAGEYLAGEVINLSGAVPDSGWGISGWTGSDDDNSTASTNTVTMPTSDHTVSVHYMAYNFLPLILGH